MDCIEYLPLLSGHLDGMNTPEQEAALKKHLAACPACRSLLVEMQENDRLLVASRLQPPADLTRRIMNQLPKRNAHRAWKPALISGLASGLCVAALMGLVVWGNIFPKSIPTAQPKHKNDTVTGVGKAVSVELPADDSLTVGTPVEGDTANEAFLLSPDTAEDGSPLTESLSTELAPSELYDSVTPMESAPPTRSSSRKDVTNLSSMLAVWDANPNEFELLSALSPVPIEELSINDALMMIPQVEDYNIIAYLVDSQTMDTLLQQCRGLYQISTLYPASAEDEECLLLFLTHK